MDDDDEATCMAPASANPSHPLHRSADVLIVAALAIVALMARWLPEGDVARLLLTLPIILFVPGYLLVQAISTRMRPRHFVAAVGISPPLVGLLALLTAVFPGGFRPTPIVITITLACFLLAGLALWRRGLFDRQPQAVQA